MKNFIVALLVNGLVVYLLAMLLPGIAVSGFVSAVLVGFVLGAINHIVKPILATLTMPLTILTFGLFLLVLNGLMVMLASYVLGNHFHVSGIITAILFSILLSMVNTMFGVPKVIGR